jgi:predicted alpha/beta superfamily hydrolase
LLQLWPGQRSLVGANHFLSFLRTELFPFVEANYRGDPERRILSGWSFGGLFGLHTLFRQPESFSDYLILSPSIWWDEKTILQDGCFCISPQKGIFQRYPIEGFEPERITNSCTIASMSIG